MILVSACLLGLSTRYDGKSKINPGFLKRISNSAKIGHVIPVCPEQLGGLPTPRPPCQLLGGDGFDVLFGKARVVEIETGRDVTKNFLKGAEEVRKIIDLFKIKKAYLKSKSPSCGYFGQTGVTAASLILNGVEIIEIR